MNPPRLFAVADYRYADVQVAPSRSSSVTHLPRLAGSYSDLQREKRASPTKRCSGRRSAAAERNR